MCHEKQISRHYSITHHVEPQLVPITGGHARVKPSIRQQMCSHPTPRHPDPLHPIQALPLKLYHILKLSLLASQLACTVKWGYLGTTLDGMHHLLWHSQSLRSVIHPIGLARSPD
jgi:hypothetical protein